MVDNMEKQQGIGGGLLRSYGASDPSVNISTSPSVVSPYLNFDPAYISNPESQFILPEGASHSRGRFELAFSQIGGSILAGATAGGLNGVYMGFKETKAAQLTGAVKRTQMLNSVTKAGASSAQTLGVVALMYSAFGVLVSKLRGADDELNTLAAATATGFLYKSSAGLKPCLRAGGVGLALASVYCVYTSKDRLKQMAGLD